MAIDKTTLTGYLCGSREQLSQDRSGLPRCRPRGCLAAAALGAGPAASPLSLLSVAAANIGGTFVYLQLIVTGLQVCKKSGARRLNSRYRLRKAPGWEGDPPVEIPVRDREVGAMVTAHHVGRPASLREQSPWTNGDVAMRVPLRCWSSRSPRELTSTRVAAPAQVHRGGSGKACGACGQSCAGGPGPLGARCCGALRPRPLAAEAEASVQRGGRRRRRARVAPRAVAGRRVAAALGQRPVSGAGSQGQATRAAGDMADCHLQECH